MTQDQLLSSDHFIFKEDSSDFDYKKHILPIIKRPQDGSLSIQYYNNFERAREALNHPNILFLLRECAEQQFKKASYTNRRLLMTDSQDLTSECYRGLLLKMSKEGFTCEAFEDSSFKAVNWLRAVFTNQARDRLKYKVPSAHHYSIEASAENENRKTIETVFAGYNAQEHLEYREVKQLQDWFVSLELSVATSSLVSLSPARRLIWKLIYHPESVSHTDFLRANIQNSRPAQQTYELYLEHKIQLCNIVFNDGERQTESKNFVLWLLFGQEYSSYEDMLNLAPESWINTTRDNQIRRTENRADTQIWKIILFGLLSNTCPQGYDSLYRSLIQFAVLRAKNSLPTSRKTKRHFLQTCQDVQEWCTKYINAEKKPRLTELNSVFAILTSNLNDGSQWRQHSCAKLIDQTYHLLRVSKKLIHN